jgi:hypothetical protein
MILFNSIIMLMSCMVTIVTILSILMIFSNRININNVAHRARIHLNVTRNNVVGIEPSTAESTVCSSVDCEEKNGDDLV